jgi:trans-aconitate 2-methyltransferase
MLAKARSAFSDLEFVQGDARDFSFAQPFDAIFCNAVLHWVRPPERVIRCVRDALRPGGRFVAELGGRGNVRAIRAAIHTAAARLGIAAQLPPWYFPGIGDYAPLLESAGLEVRFAALFDRPTPLKGADGLKGWVQMFARPTLEAISEQHREEFLSAVEESARSELFRDGGWIADYRRLRVVAVRTPDVSRDRVER